MDYENMIVEMDDRVATLTLNRPDQRNALSRALRDELRDFLKNRLGSCDAVVLTGAGPAFCAGMDLKEPVGYNEGEEQWSLFKELFNIDTVFIAALNGPARGAGLTIVAACDLAIAEPTANFGMPQITHGIYGGVAATMLQLSIPRKIVGEMVLTGLPITADRACEAGLINVVSEPGEALTMAQSLAKRIAGFRPEAVSTVKQMLQRVPFDDAKREASVREAKLMTLLAGPLPDDRKIDTKYA